LRVPKQAPKDYLGFIYRIERKSDGKFYIGKKQYWAGSKPPSAYKNKQCRETDWKTYWGSSKDLQEDIKALGLNSFTRTILMQCKNKWDLAYNELILQLENKVLEKDTNSYNGIVHIRLNKRKK
jgi:hypothetical protein